MQEQLSLKSKVECLARRPLSQHAAQKCLGIDLIEGAPQLGTAAKFPVPNLHS